MTKRTQIILTIIVVIAAIVTVFAALYTPTRSDTISRPTIKIGLMLPLSGTQTHLGTAVRQAAEQFLAEKEPSSRYRYETVVVDSVSAQKANDTKADILFSLAPEPRVAISFGADEQKPLIIHTTYKEATSLLNEDFQKKGITNVGLITESIGDYRKLATSLRDSLSKDSTFNGAVFTTGQTDFKAIINKLRNSDAEIFVLTGNPEDLGNLVQALNNYGISNYQISSLYSIDLTSRPELYDNIRFVGSTAGAYDAELVTSALQNLIKAYEANYKKNLLPGSQVIRDYFEKNLSQDGIISIPATLKKVENGKILDFKE